MDDEPVGTDDPTFAALLTEVARAPAIPSERLLMRGERAGEHEIVSVIGQGAFGTVYRAVHPVLRSEVAIKVLASVHAADPGVAQRFIEEARAIHRIRHPNIVELFGFGELPNGQMYYAMELLSGKTLAAHLEERGAFSPALALHVLSQVADALEAAHGSGVLHRDLKPDNIFVVGELNQSCRVKLLDFGIAKLLGDESSLRTRSGVLMGTPAYMSPEQCGGEQVDFKSDIYALGVIAHELLTGRRPFEGRNVRETIAQHMFDQPPRASTVRPGLSSKYDAPLLAMLDKDPRKRPASAKEAVRMLAGEAVTPTEIPPTSRRGRVVWAVASLFILLALWTIHGLLRRGHEPESALEPKAQSADGAAPARADMGFSAPASDARSPTSSPPERPEPSSKAEPPPAVAAPAAENKPGEVRSERPLRPASRGSSRPAAARPHRDLEF